MFLRLRGGSNKTRVIRVGDAVIVRKLPGDTPRSRIDSSTPPSVVAIRRRKGVKLATVSYVDAEDGQTHMMELPPSSLRVKSSDETLQIGDHITLVTRGGAILPSTGSTGVVLGGGEGEAENYTIAFTMTHDLDGLELEHSVSVTQDWVPRHALQFAGDASDDEGKNEDDEDEDDEDEDEDDDEDEDKANDDEGARRASPSLATLKQRLSSSVRARLMQMLSLEELEELASRLDDDEKVDGGNINAVLAVLMGGSRSRTSTPLPSSPQSSTARPAAAR